MPNKQNWVYKMSGNAWDKRMERMGMLKYQNTDQNGAVNPNIADRFRRYGMEVPAWAQGGQTTTPSTATNPTPGQSTGGGQGQNVRFNQKVNKMDRAAQGQARQTFATSDRRDTIGDARDAGAPTVTPRKPSVIGATGTVGAAPKRNPFNATATPPAWLKTPAVQNWPPAQNVNRNTGTNTGGTTPRVPSGLPNGVPNWALPAAPRIPSGLPTNQIPSGIPAAPRVPSGIPANTGNYTPVSSARREPSIPAGVMPGGGFANNANGGTVYYSPDGKRYWVAPDGRFIPSQTNQNNLVGGSDIGTAYDQAALARLAYARTMSGYLQPLASTPSTFGSYYGGGFGGGYGGGGGGGYTSYDPYNSNPSWYNSLDLTAWNIQ